MGSMVTSSKVMQYLKWRSFTLRCLVLYLCLWNVEISNAPLLSSKTLHLNLGLLDYIENPALFISFRSYIIGITPLKAYDSTVYYDSVLDNMISVCNWYFHTKGHPVYIIIQPYLDHAVSFSNDSYLSHFPVKSASTYNSRYFLSLVSKVLDTMPYLLSYYISIPYRNLPVWRSWGQSPLLGTFPTISRIGHATYQRLT